MSWSAANGTPPYTLNLSYSTDDGLSYPGAIATGIIQTENGTGSHSWTLPLINSTLVRVRAELTDSRGQRALAQSPAPFEIDSSPPHVLQTTPVDGARGVSTETSIRIRFSEPVERASAQGAISIEGPGSPSLSSPSWSGAELTLQTSGLALEAMYRVTVAPSVRDDSDPGNSMAAPCSFTFNTSSAPVPFIYLAQPAGGERWVAGETRDILWDAGGGTGELRVNLSYSTSGPEGPWLNISAGEANDGLYEWLVPDTPSTSCYVRAEVLDSFSPPKSASDTSDEPFTIVEAPVPLSVELLSPDGGERLVAGSRLNITCASSGGNGERRVALQYSTTGPLGPWTDIAAGESDDGLFEWTVADVETESGFVRVTVTDSYQPPQTASDTSNASFAIVPAPVPLSVRLTSPNGGENWTAGSRREITWSSSGGNGARSVRIELSTLGRAGPWSAIASGEADDGRYQWRVPDTPSEECMIRITVTDSYDPPQLASDESDAPFVISPVPADSQPPQVAVTYPPPGARVGGTVLVRVGASDNVCVTRVELLIDGELAASFTSGPFEYSWDTTLFPDGNHTLSARAWDGAGNLGASPDVSVQVENRKPREPAREASLIERYGWALAAAAGLAVLLALVAVLAARGGRRGERGSP